MWLVGLLLSSDAGSRYRPTAAGAAYWLSIDICRRSSCGSGQRHVQSRGTRLKKGKDSPYSISERRVPELIPVLGSQPAGDVSHKPGGRLPLLSARPAVTPATLKRAATSFAAW